MITPRRLGIAALAMGALASVAGSPYASQRAQVDVRALARTVAREEDHVTAVELARWIRDHHRGLRVVDVRSQAEFDAFHIPTAERLPVDTIITAPFGRDETIVLYSEGGTHAAQAWFLLRALGYEKVYFLRGGAYEWLEQVMSPTLSPTATPAERAAFDSVAAVSRYFGGVPQVGVERSTADDAKAVPRADGARADDARAGGAVPIPAATTATPSAVLRVRRRGC